MKTFIFSISLLSLFAVFACNNASNKMAEEPMEVQEKKEEKEEDATETETISEKEKKITAAACDCAEEMIELLNKIEEGKEISDSEKRKVTDRMDECHDALRKKYSGTIEDKGEDGIKKYTKELCPEFYELMLKSGTVKE